MWNPNPIAQMRAPAMVPIPVGTVVEGEVDASTLVAGVCVLKQFKYWQEMLVTDDFLAGASFFKSPYSNTVMGVKDRLHELGRFHHGNMYVGCYVKERDRKAQTWRVSHIWYEIRWSHQENCTKLHPEVDVDTLKRHGFYHSPNPLFYGASADVLMNDFGNPRCDT